MSGRDRTLVAMIAVLVVAVGGWLILVQPVRSQANGLQGQINSAHTRLLQAEAAITNGQAAETEYDKFATQLRAVAVAVPAQVQVPRLIDELQAASDRSHTEFQTVTLGGSSTSATPTSSTAGTTSTAGKSTAAVAAATIPDQQFSLTFVGGYFAVTKLLGELAGLVRADNDDFKATGRLLTISTVALIAGPAGPPQVSANVTVSDYIIPAGLSTSATATTTATAAADITSR